MIEHLPRFIADYGKKLEDVGIERGKGEIEIILCYLLDCDRLDLYLHGEQRFNQEHFQQFNEILKKRITRYPLQYILKESWFYGRRFKVSPDVMVPTPETELLCETAIKFIESKKLKKPKIVDLGVGSGVIAITLAKELDECSILGLDISSDALKVAHENAVNFIATDNIDFLESDYFENVPTEMKFDLILANPPYISEDEYKELPPEVLADPKISLTSGEEGLDAIKKILSDAPDYLEDDGKIMFEIGYKQANQVTELTSNDNRFKSIVILKDLNDIDRVVILSCNK
jgi:release factor glutamine methyltransferase